MTNIVTIKDETIIFDPEIYGNWYYHGVFYGRGIELKHGEGRGNIYLTCEYYKELDEHFPIFESTDGGKTFSHISDIYNTEFTRKKYKNESWKMLYQPTFCELSKDLGQLKKGTVLCVGTTVANSHCAIVIYYSTDNLRTWNYLSTVAEGGRCNMEIGSAIWEGFLVLDKGILYCFYSDERGMNKGGQRIVVKTSTDGKNWSEDIKVCDFEEENPKYRPGMPIVTKMPDERFLLTYEGVNMGSPHPGFYKITDDIAKWDCKDHGVLMPSVFGGGSPYCATMPDGKVIIGSHGTKKIGVNEDCVKTNEWQLFDTCVEIGYTRCLCPLSNGDLMIISGGSWNAKGARKLKIAIKRFV